MKKKSGVKRVCTLLLGTAIVLGGLPADMVRAETESDKSQEKFVIKRTEFQIEDDFEDGLDEAWFDQQGTVSCEGGVLKLTSDNNVSSIRRNVGNGDFSAEFQLGGYSADTTGNHSVVIFRVSDGSENNLAEIQRFSNGELKLLVINEGKQTSYTTGTDYQDAESWFRIGYNSEEKTLTAEYKASGETEYIPLEGSGSVMENFGGAHVAELRAQQWGGNLPLSIQAEKFTATFVKENEYERTEKEEFDGEAIGDIWYGVQSAELGEGSLAMHNSGEGISTVKRNIGDEDYSVEMKWSDFVSDGTGAAIMRVSVDSSEQEYVQIARQGDDTLRFTVVEDGKAAETQIPYGEDSGWLRLDYDNETGTVDAYYRNGDDEIYSQLPGSGKVVGSYAGVHTLELIADNWGVETETSVLVDSVDMAYNESLDLRLESDRFDVLIDEETGGVFQITDPADGYGTNYVMNPDIRPAFDVNDSRWVGDMKFTVKKESDPSYTASVTSLSDDVRNVTREDDTIKVSYEESSSNAAGIKDFALTESYSLNETGDQLIWTIDIENTSGEKLEIADMGFPLLMNSWWNSTQDGIYEQNVARHSYVAKDGSYIYWQRPNGDGSFLVMVPQDGTSLEFKDKARYNEGPFAEVDPQWEGLVEYFIHSAEISKTRDGGYLDASSLTMEAGESKQYGFVFQWADSYSDLRDILYEAGSVDAVSFPGMVIPEDMKATLAVRCKEQITGVTGDTEGITVEKKEDRNGYEIYEIRFTQLGPNQVTVHYGDDKSSVLQYYATKSVEELIETNTDFIVNNQQAKTEKGYNGAYLQWNMDSGKQISWDDYPGGGWKQWMAGGSDDSGLSPAVYLSEKNVTAPEQEQIESLEYYLENFIWGYMQQHDTYKIYRWYDGQEGTPADQGTWRSYNYVHVANTYYNMYRIAERYPDMVNYLDADGYLLRCYNTLKAYFTYSMFDGTPGTDTVNGSGGLGAYKFGNMGEMNLPDIIEALSENGYTEESGWLSGKVKEKATDHIFATEYPFASEMSIDTTGFESCYTLAKMYGNDDLAEKVTKASLACRGIQPVWYYYGSDNRHMGESWWNLGYETQIGAWQQQDYLLNYLDTEDEEFDDIMRGTYGAYLAGWANINVGQISSDPANYGAASWQYQSEKGTSNYNYIPNLDGWWAWSGESSLGFWGGLKTASANIVDDEIMGGYGYGCDLSSENGIYTIVPKDGVRTRLNMYNLGKFGVQLDKARYTEAEISEDLRTVRLTLENVTGQACSPEITFANLPQGEYEVVVGNQVVQELKCDADTVKIQVEIGNTDTEEVLLRANGTEEPGGTEDTGETEEPGGTEGSGETEEPGGTEGTGGTKQPETEMGPEKETAGRGDQTGGGLVDTSGNHENKQKAVQTGDTSNVEVYFILCFAALTITISIIAVKIRKRKL